VSIFLKSLLGGLIFILVWIVSVSSFWTTAKDEAAPVSAIGVNEVPTPKLLPVDQPGQMNQPASAAPAQAEKIVEADHSAVFANAVRTMRSKEVVIGSPDAKPITLAEAIEVANAANERAKKAEAAALINPFKATEK